MNNDINEKIVHAAPVPPFVRFVASAVPMVFDNSLSYYECLCALWKWMQDNLVDVINHNATVTEQYIDYDLHTRELFIELKSYVDNYFDNLDVQEEINNKLDQMAESGELQQIIADYLKTQIIYDTTLDMIADASNLVAGVRVETLGYRTVDDNGAAFFVIKNTGTADGKSVIALDGGLYAHMVYKHDFVTPEMFGAYGDGVNDHNDSDAIQYAINTGKTVEFAPKTYICYSLTVSTPAVLHGNGATLKRPELDIAPYNMTVAQMKWIRTIAVSEDCTIDGLTFDNNCFTMWQVSDGYAQEQSSSVFVSNDTKKIKFNIDNCHFKNSASDGLHIVVNVVANISNCTSEDCFRGGFVSTGYGSEINLNGWDSKVITPGVNDGFDIEVDSPSTVDDQCYKVNINNVILDYDLDIAIPSYGQCTMSNIVMREFDQDTQGGASLRCNNGSLIVSNSVLRTGKLGNVQTYVHNDAVIILDSCRIYGNSIEACLKVTQYQETTYNSKLLINNCNVSCYDFIQCGNFCGEISINNCNIECSHWCLAPNGPSIPQFSTGFIIQNSFVKFADRFLQVGRNQYAPNGKSKFYLSNLHLTGASGSEIYVSGSPDVYYNNLVMESALILTKAPGASPKFYGDKRVIIVDSSADLTFAGWVAGNDIAITRDTGARYQYTSGTNWTAL